MYFLDLRDNIISTDEEQVLFMFFLPSRMLPYGSYDLEII